MMAQGDYIRNAIVNFRYHEGGRGPVCFDCWGLAMDYYREVLGLAIPDLGAAAASIDHAGELLAIHHGQEVDLEEIRRHDLVLMRLESEDQVDHVGIHTGEFMALHASSKWGIVRHPLGPYKKRDRIVKVVRPCV